MNRHWLVSIAIPLGMALNLASAHAQTSSGTLHGITAKDGTPLAEAQIVIHREDDNSDLTVTSGSDGAYTVSNLKPGQYAVKASKGELQSSSATVYVAGEQNLKVDLALGASADDISPAVAKKLEAMRARLEQQMQAELKKFEEQLKADSADSAKEQPISPARHGDLLATTTNDPSQIPIVPATLGKPDPSKAVASA